MYRRLIILSVIIFCAFAGLTWLGYRAIEIQASGMDGARLGEFAATAEQIRQDVKRKLDEFIRKEQSRPYTDYQYYYVPENTAQQQVQQMPLLRSPLAGGMEQGLAYGYFQIESDGTIITPYYDRGQVNGADKNGLSQKARAYIANLERNLLPRLNMAGGTFTFSASQASEVRRPSQSESQTKAEQVYRQAGSKSRSNQQAKEYPIKSLTQESQQAQVVMQQRAVAASNMMQNTENTRSNDSQIEAEGENKLKAAQSDSMMDDIIMPQEINSKRQSETIEIKIEPFVPIIVAGKNGESSFFDGQVFLLRRVQIEGRHFLQGFQLDTEKLINEIRGSAAAAMKTRKGMDFKLSQSPKDDATYAAILNFGFGDLVLNLSETDPGWITKQISQLRNWYFSIIAVVFLAVTLGLLSLWRNAAAQLKLAQKKDDFISAVSHELRTPLTSIRMYSEMLEKNWVKSQDKQAEYYTNMRQESERLSRLIENVLDFSRIQRGKKKYSFTLGDINQCIAAVIKMMTPYAEQNGFSIQTDFGQCGQAAFDHDAVTQIVVNLLDNAIKYARNAGNKTVIVRTRSESKYIIIEVEDRGPGIPRYQRKKVFDQFYRCEAESTRETAGTGLGLALVKKFAEAHNGFVEIVTAKPTGAIFRIALAIQD